MGKNNGLNNHNTNTHKWYSKGNRKGLADYLRHRRNSMVSKISMQNNKQSFTRSGVDSKRERDIRMKKYVFAKDIFPFGRKNEFINVEVDCDFGDRMNLYNDKDGNHFLDCQDNLVLNEFIKQGIIKEFEPRIVFVEYKKGENGINYLNDVAGNIEHYAHHITQPIYSIVKFIEVSE